MPNHTGPASCVTEQPRAHISHTRGDDRVPHADSHWVRIRDFRPFTSCSGGCGIPARGNHLSWGQSRASAGVRHALDHWFAGNDLGCWSSSPAAPTPPRDWPWSTNVNAPPSQPGRHPNPFIASSNPDIPTSLSPAVPSPLYPSASYPVSGKRPMVPNRSTTINPKSTTPTVTEHGRTLPPKAQTPGAHPSSGAMKPQVGFSADVKHARRF